MSFKVGQRVVALKNYYDSDMSRPLIKGNIEIVKAVISCEVCSKKSYDIGISYVTQTLTIFWNECSCGSKVVSSVASFGHKSLAPIEEKRNHNKAEITISIKKPVEEIIDCPVEEVV